MIGELKAVYSIEVFSAKVKFNDLTFNTFA